MCQHAAARQIAAPVVVGVGNIYASESLFTAGIIPDRAAGSLSQAEAELLVNTIKAVLLRSIEQGGTTLDQQFRFGLRQTAGSTIGNDPGGKQ